MKEFLELLEKAIAVAPDKEAQDALDKLLFKYSQEASRDSGLLLYVLCDKVCAVCKKIKPYLKSLRAICPDLGVEYKQTESDATLRSLKKKYYKPGKDVVSFNGIPRLLFLDPVQDKAVASYLVTNAVATSEAKFIEFAIDCVKDAQAKNE